MYSLCLLAQSLLSAGFARDRVEAEVALEYKHKIVVLSITKIKKIPDFGIGSWCFDGGIGHR